MSLPPSPARRGHVASWICGALASLLVLIAAGTPAPAGATLEASIRIPNHCPWTKASVVATHTPAQLAAMVLARLTTREKIRLLGIEQPSERENLIQGIPTACIPNIGIQDGPDGITTGGAMDLPDELSVGATFDTTTAQQLGMVLGSEAWRRGIAGVQAPSLNLAVLPTWGRVGDAYSEDPYLTGLLGLAEVHGITSAHAMAILKHVGVYVQELDRGALQMRLSPRAIQEIYLAPFWSVLHGGEAAGAMCAYGTVNGTLQCEDPALVAQLRDEGFAGIIRTDLEATGDPVGSITSGVDLLKPAATQVLTDALYTGQLSMQSIDAADLVVLTTLFSHRILTHPLTGSLNGAKDPRSDRATVLAAAEEGAVLLKNNGVLPLSPDLHQLAIIGPWAADPTFYVGGSSGVIPHRQVSPLTGLSQAFSDASILTNTADLTSGTNLLDEDGSSTTTSSPTGATTTTVLEVPSTGTYLVRLGLTASYSAATVSIDDNPVAHAHDLEGDGSVLDSATITLTAGIHVVGTTWTGPSAPTVAITALDPLLDAAAATAARAKVAIVVVGDRSGEDRDRSSLNLPDGQDALIEAVAKANPHTIVVLNTDGAVLMPWLDKVSAVLEQWYPGEVDGTALANLLDGSVDPSGHLPITFPSSVRASPVATFNAQGDAATTNETLDLNGPDGTGLLVGYRYYRQQHLTPLFPFGFGLSYTTFSLSNLKIATVGSTTTATVSVTNTGKVLGRSVVQGYVTFPARAEEPPALLRAVGSITLKPGATGKVELVVPRSALEVWLSGSTTVVPGTYTLAVGQSSADLGLTGTFTLSANAAEDASSGPRGPLGARRAPRG